MPRKDGEKTRQRILKVAEKLFSQKGFDGTSVERIANAAKVNKALIYYHFKNKNDLIMNLFTSILDELAVQLESAAPEQPPPRGNRAIKAKIREEVEQLADRKRILSVMLMEALRSDDRDDILFQCAELVMRHEEQRQPSRPKRRSKAAMQRHRVHEFFTGFMPLLAFVTLRDKWCDHFGCDPTTLQDDFLDAFTRSHLASHH